MDTQKRNATSQTNINLSVITTGFKVIVNTYRTGEFSTIGSETKDMTQLVYGKIFYTFFLVKHMPQQ